MNHTTKATPAPPSSVIVLADPQRALSLAAGRREIHVHAYETTWTAVDRLRDMADKAGLTPRLTARHAQALCLTMQP